MSNSDVTCPQCGHQFELNVAVQRAVEGRLRREIEEHYKLREDAARQEVERRAVDLGRKLDELHAAEQLANAREAALVAKQRDAELLLAQREVELQRKVSDDLAAARLSMEDALEQRVQQQLATTTAELRGHFEEQHKREVARAEREAARQLGDASSQLAELKMELDGLRVAEAVMLRRAREVEERERGLDLDLERRLDSERKALREEGARDGAERAAREQQAKLADLEADLLRAREAAVEGAAREAEARQVRADLERQKRALETGEEERIALACKEAADEAVAVAAVRLEAQFAEQKRVAAAELESARKQREHASKREAEALDLRAQADEKLASFDVDLKRRVLEERQKMHELAAKERQDQALLHAQQRELREQEHQEKERQLTRALADMHQKIQQGSMQVQGEAQEQALRARLADAFGSDVLDDVPVGVTGADLLQRVRSPSGLHVGTIIWESKRTKNWASDWVTKLRGDARATNATVAVIVTQALPEGVHSFAERDGVWVCAWPYATALASVLRRWIIELAQSRQAAEGQTDKVHTLYRYLTGPHFRQRTEGIVDAYRVLRADLEEERRSTLRRWKKRETSLDGALKSLADLQGELDSIQGKQLEGFPILVFGAGDDESDDEPFTAPALSAQADSPRPDRALLEGSADDVLVALLEELLPGDNATVGNQTMRGRFVDAALTRLGRRVGEVEYLAARAELEARGVLARGQGRGGTVRRVARMAPAFGSIAHTVVDGTPPVTHASGEDLAIEDHEIALKRRQLALTAPATGGFVYRPAAQAAPPAPIAAPVAAPPVAPATLASIQAMIDALNGA